LKICSLGRHDEREKDAKRKNNVVHRREIQGAEKKSLSSAMPEKLAS
jgi:hypothetical protein